MMIMVRIMESIIRLISIIMMIRLISIIMM